MLPEAVEAHWEAAGTGRPQLILPDGCVDVVARDGGLTVIGPMTCAKNVVAHGPVAGLRFAPGLVASWMRVSPRALLDQVVDARDVDALAGARSLADVVTLCREAQGCPATAFTVDVLCRRPSTPIHRVAAELGMSARHLQRLFAAQVGLSPKRFARVQRMWALVRAWRAGARQPLASQAALAGYADQAHMTREVGALCGMPPSQLRATMSESFKPSASR